jgi:hypothetical protein
MSKRKPRKVKGLFQRRVDLITSMKNAAIEKGSLAK